MKFLETIAAFLFALVLVPIVFVATVWLVIVDFNKAIERIWSRKA